MNFDPTKYFYTINPASCKIGVDVVLVRLETQETKVLYVANQTASSAGLKQHLDSLTDDLFLDFFVKGKEARKLEKERQRLAKEENERIFNT